MAARTEEKGFKVWKITALKRHGDHDKALETLHRVANHVEPLMKKYRWRVKLLAEFSPKDDRLLGININRSTVKIRLRRPGSDAFYPYEHTLGTMLHELTHMKVGPHNAKFYALLDTLRGEMETLMAQGHTASTMATKAGFPGAGKSLGGTPTLASRRRPSRSAAREERAKAMERLLKHKQLTAGSGRTLGGRDLARGKRLRDVIADAAERRLRDNRWCPAERAHQAVATGADHSAEAAPAPASARIKRCGSTIPPPPAVARRRRDAASLPPATVRRRPLQSGWTCATCTFAGNPALFLACKVCGTPQQSAE